MSKDKIFTFALQPIVVTQNLQQGQRGCVLSKELPSHAAVEGNRKCYRLEWLSGKEAMAKPSQKKNFFQCVQMQCIKIDTAKTNAKQLPKRLSSGMEVKVI